MHFFLQDDVEDILINWVEYVLLEHQHACLDECISLFTWQKKNPWCSEDVNRWLKTGRTTTDRQYQKLFFNAGVVDNQIIMAALICLISIWLYRNKIISRTRRSEYLLTATWTWQYILHFASYSASLNVLPLFKRRRSVFLHLIRLLCPLAWLVCTATSNMF